MNMRYVPAVVTALSVSVVPAPQVRADSGWAFLGGIIAGSVVAHNAATLAARQEMYDREATASYVRQQRALMDPPPATAVMPDPAVSSRDADVQAAWMACWDGRAGRRLRNFSKTWAGPRRARWVFRKRRS